MFSRLGELGSVQSAAPEFGLLSQRLMDVDTIIIIFISVYCHAFWKIPPIALVQSFDFVEIGLAIWLFFKWHQARFAS